MESKGNCPFERGVVADSRSLQVDTKARDLVAWNIHQNKYKNVSDSDLENCASTHLCFHVLLSHVLSFLNNIAMMTIMALSCIHGHSRNAELSENRCYPDPGVISYLVVFPYVIQYKVI